MVVTNQNIVVNDMIKIFVGVNPLILRSKLRLQRLSVYGGTESGNFFETEELS